MDRYSKRIEGQDEFDFSLGIIKIFQPFELEIDTSNHNVRIILIQRDMPKAYFSK